MKIVQFSITSFVFLILFQKLFFLGRIGFYFEKYPSLQLEVLNFQRRLPSNMLLAECL